MDSFGDEIEKMGFPKYYPGTARAPFDSISDFLWGMHGAMLDMYRQPDKLLQACERIYRRMMEKGIPGFESNEDGVRPLLFMGLHRGSDGFMSRLIVLSLFISLVFFAISG